MRKLLILMVLFSSCLSKPAPPALRPLKKQLAAITQVCIDSIYRKPLLSKINNVVLEKTTYFADDQTFNWGHKPIAYKKVSDELKKARWTEDGGNNPAYLLKVDSVALTNTNAAYSRILCIGQGAQSEFYLTFAGGKWKIAKEIVVDYEE